jgi:hypothetical protein
MIETLRPFGVLHVYSSIMLKWLLTVLVVLVILAAVAPWFGRVGLGRLPGDLRIPLRGRMYYVPFASTVLLSLLVWAIGKLF